MDLLLYFGKLPTNDFISWRSNQQHKRMSILLISTVIDCRAHHKTSYLREVFCSVPWIWAILRTRFVLLAWDVNRSDAGQALSLGLKEICSLSSHSWDSSHNCHVNEPRPACGGWRDHVEQSRGISGEATLSCLVSSQLTSWPQIHEQGEPRPVVNWACLRRDRTANLCTCELVNAYYFKPVSFGVVHNVKIDHGYTHWHMISSISEIFINEQWHLIFVHLIF